VEYCCYARAAVEIVDGNVYVYIILKQIHSFMSFLAHNLYFEKIKIGF
jgi:hypothetical protein